MTDRGPDAVSVRPRIEVFLMSETSKRPRVVRVGDRWAVVDARGRFAVLQPAHAFPPWSALREKGIVFNPGDAFEVIVRHWPIIRNLLHAFVRPDWPWHPDWRTSTVVGIAEGMYNPHDFSPAPILADALQDAGCDHEGILGHLRAPDLGTTDEPIARGDWVLDMCLSKRKAKRQIGKVY